MVNGMRKYLLSLMLCAALAASASLHAQLLQLRFLPEKGERGRLGENQALPMVKIGNRVMRLSPGGLIFDQNNRTILHGSLPPGADVLYTKDMNGDVQRIYILTDQERANLDAARRR